MIKQTLLSIYRVDVWPMMALILFVVFFLGVLLFAFTRKAAYVESLRALPLDDETPCKESGHE